MTSRAMMSVPPPAGNGTISLIGLVGQRLREGSRGVGDAAGSGSDGRDAGGGWKASIMCVVSGEDGAGSEPDAPL